MYIYGWCVPTILPSCGLEVWGLGFGFRDSGFAQEDHSNDDIGGPNPIIVPYMIRFSVRRPPVPPPPHPPNGIPPTTLPKPSLCDCASIFHMRAPKPSRGSRPKDARSV